MVFFREQFRSRLCGKERLAHCGGFGTLSKKLDKTKISNKT